MKKWIDKTERIARCRSTSVISGRQCVKAKSHVSLDIDVTHKAGMFIWRDEPIRGLKDTTFSTAWLPKDSMFPRVSSVPPFDDSVCTCPKCVNDRERAERDEWGRAAKAFAEGAAPETAEDRFMDLTHKMSATPAQQLTEWWIARAEDEVARTVPKAIEYSATDLTDIGHDLARTQGREVDDEEAAELGVFFYLRGKMARWVGAVIADQRVSDDTLFDIGVYVRMAQRIREKGNWPGTEDR